MNKEQGMMKEEGKREIEGIRHQGLGIGGDLGIKGKSSRLFGQEFLRGIRMFFDTRGDAAFDSIWIKFRVAKVRGFKGGGWL